MAGLAVTLACGESSNPSPQGTDETTQATSATTSSGDPTGDSTEGTSMSSSDDGLDTSGGSTGNEPSCGNGIVEPNEQCDGGPKPSDPCLPDCTFAPGTVLWRVDEAALVPQGLTLADDRLWVVGQTVDAIATIRTFDLEGNEQSSVDYAGDVEPAQGTDVSVDATGRVFVSGAVGSPLSGPPVRAQAWGLDQRASVQWAEQLVLHDSISLAIAEAVVVHEERVTVAGFGLGLGATWFVAQYDPMGTAQWTDVDDTLGVATDLAVLGDGSIVVLGTQVIRRYSVAGDAQWTVPVEAGMGAQSIAADATGLVFGGGSGSAWLARLSFDGESEWSKPVAATGIQAIALDPDGNIDVIALPTTPDDGIVVLEVDGEALSPEEEARGGEAPRWSVLITVKLPTTEHFPGSVTTDAQGRVYACGLLRSAADTTGWVAAIAG